MSEEPLVTVFKGSYNHLIERSNRLIQAEERIQQLEDALRNIESYEADTANSWWDVYQEQVEAMKDIAHAALSSSASEPPQEEGEKPWPRYPLFDSSEAPVELEEE